MKQVWVARTYDEDRLSTIHAVFDDKELADVFSRAYNSMVEWPDQEMSLDEFIVNQVDDDDDSDNE